MSDKIVIDEDEELTQDQVNEMPTSLDEFVQGLEPRENFKIILRRGKETIRSFNSDELEDAEFDAVGEKYGAGKYTWVITWYNKKDHPNPGNQMKQITRTLAEDHYGEIHEQYILKKNRLKGSQGQEMNLDIIREVFQAVKPFMSQQQAPAQNNTELIALMMKSQEQNAQMMMTLMTGMMQSMSAMFTSQPKEVVQGNDITQDLLKTLVLKQIDKPKETDPMGMFNNMMTMASGLIDIKKSNEPEPEKNAVDRLLDMVEGLAPTLLTIASKPPESQKNNMMYKLAMNNQAVADVKESSLEDKQKLVEGLSQKLDNIEDFENVYNMIREPMGLEMMDSQVSSFIANEKNNNSAPVNDSGNVNESVNNDEM